MFTVYVLQSLKRKYLYVGITNSIQRRFVQHQNGNERTTRAYRPFRLTHLEHFTSRQEARNREKFLKSGCGKEWLKTHISQSDVPDPLDNCPGGGIGRRASLRS